MMEQIISKYSQSIENDSKIPSSFAEVNVNLFKKRKEKILARKFRRLLMNIGAKVLINLRKIE